MRPKKKKENRSYINPAKQFVTAHCPRCRDTFRVELFWSGTGKYYEYCKECKLVVPKYSECNEHAVSAESGIQHYCESNDFLYLL